MSKPIKLFRHPLSGHAHRVELFLSLLNVPTELVFVDLANGAHKTPEFLAMNPFGQVPVIDDNGVVLSDANAILVYLAKSTTSALSGCPRIRCRLPKCSVGCQSPPDRSRRARPPLA